MRIPKYIPIITLLLTCWLPFAGVAAEGEGWVYGKWELTYDPDGAKKDYLEFLPNGDALSTGPNGKAEGIYIVDGDTVKAVFTWQGKDFIMTFFRDPASNALKIVTSHTGRESIYQKVKTP